MIEKVYDCKEITKHNLEINCWQIFSRWASDSFLRRWSHCQVMGHVIKALHQLFHWLRRVSPKWTDISWVFVTFGKPLEFWKTSQISLKGFYAFTRRNSRPFDIEIYRKSATETLFLSHLRDTELNLCMMRQHGSLIQSGQKRRLNLLLAIIKKITIFNHCHTNIHLLLERDFMRIPK